MKTGLFAGLYILAMIAANLAAFQWGKAAVPLIAFVLIGLDLALRDWLHIRLKVWQMGALIGIGGLLTLALNPAAAAIAQASAAAFTAAAVVDWLVFQHLKGSFFKRSLGSSIPAALVDSIVFPWMAFGGIDPKIVVAMFAAKVLGAAMWALLISKLR